MMQLFWISCLIILYGGMGIIYLILIKSLLRAIYTLQVLDFSTRNNLTMKEITDLLSTIRVASSPKN